MTDWLIQQQGVLSVALILLLVTDRRLTGQLGAVFSYRLWLLVPLTLLLNNLHF
ncbi:hypothetical protein [Alteromonas sp. CYL-A6]|uniref:hypothetical protein n=1 Tax=Alteromonas nitratireducens TaxID=3390813 RepID=UPI0034C48E6A